MNSWFYWDPDPIAFHFPFFHFPIFWYGILFAFGFFISFYLFRFLFYRYLCFYPQFTFSDIKNWELLSIEEGLSIKEKKQILSGNQKERAQLLKKLNQKMASEKKEMIVSSCLNHFTKRYLSSFQFQIFKMRLYFDKKQASIFFSLKEKSVKFTEKLMLYVALGTIVGARLGHLLFYENFEEYVFHPLVIIQTWKGGLASHGAVIGILIALFLFLLKEGKKYSMISFLSLIDLLVIPAAYLAVLIRFGNFINQEVVGRASQLPWAVCFGHPAGGLSAVPRHPAQLYEAIFYLFLFFFLFYFYPKALKKKGRLGGLFFIFTFSFRFFIEFFKEEQSYYLNSHFCTMGQYLSIPCILVGCFFLFKTRIVCKTPGIGGLEYLDFFGKAKGKLLRAFRGLLGKR